jgi:hypothetical protein
MTAFEAGRSPRSSPELNSLCRFDGSA